MSRGGWHGRGGPQKDPNALRRDRDKLHADDVRVLPAAGRRGRAPAWPLTPPSKREREVWVRQWRRPQAVEWERNGQAEEVALYVRTFVAAEHPDATAAMRGLVLRLQEALGLSLPGMARNKWRIGEPAPAHPRPPAPASLDSARERLRGGAS